MAFQNINDVLTYLLNAPLGDADPAVVAQPGPTWLWISQERHGLGTSIPHYTRVEPGVISFWRRRGAFGGMYVDLVRIMLAGSQIEGQGGQHDIFGPIGEAWDKAVTQMRTSISNAPGAIFWPKSTYDLADLLNGVAWFSQTRFGELYDQNRAVQRDDGSFRGSAMQAWDLLVRNTAAKFDRMPDQLRAIAVQLRDLADKQQQLVDRLQEGLTRLGSYNGIDWSDPSNVVIWLFDQATMTRTVTGDYGSPGTSSDINPNRDLGHGGGRSAQNSSESVTIVLNFPQLGLTVDVFAASQADWSHLSNAMRLFYARQVREFFEETVAAANVFEEKMHYVNQIMKLDRAAPDIPMPPPPDDLP